MPRWTAASEDLWEFEDETLQDLMDDAGAPSTGATAIDITVGSVPEVAKTKVRIKY